MKFTERLVNFLIENKIKKTIVLPESNDIRVLEAALKITELGFANIILIGNSDKIREIKNDFDFNNITVIDPLTFDRYDELVNYLYELRKDKGMTLDNAKEILKNYVYFGTMLVKVGIADGLVAGAMHSTADILRPALQIIKTSSEAKLVSSFFIMEVPNSVYGENGLFIFSDCGLIENPTAYELSEIALASAKTCKEFLQVEPRVAMLSYSTKGSAESELTNKVIEATNLVMQKNSNLLIDGELQLDAAIDISTAQKKAPNSKVAGQANVLIFPDLNAGNIGYKLVEKLAKANAYGPITQGLAKPINDLSRSCKTDDIVGVVAITCIQANNIEER